MNELEVGQRVKVLDATNTEWMVGKITEITSRNVCWLDIECGPAQRIVRCVEEVFPVDI